MLVVLAGCGPNYSPNTYASAAVQQANPTQRGVVVGVRKVGVSADATLGTVTGAAAGGIAGAGVDGGGPITALSALGGSVIGGVVGSGVEHATGDTTAYEYIVQEAKGDLVSVTQRDSVPLAIGQKVLVIAGKQARVVADYTVPLPEQPAVKNADKGKPPAPVASIPAPSATPSSASASSAPSSLAPSSLAPASSAAAPPPSTTAASPASANAAPVVPPFPAAADVPAVSAPIAAALDGSDHPATTPAPAAPAAPSVTSAGGAVTAAPQPGAPVTLALPTVEPSPAPAPTSPK
jgi:outer membrane lipoprotein SlyB